MSEHKLLLVRHAACGTESRVMLTMWVKLSQDHWDSCSWDSDNNITLLQQKIKQKMNPRHKIDCRNTTEESFTVIFLTNILHHYKFLCNKRVNVSTEYFLPLSFWPVFAALSAVGFVLGVSSLVNSVLSLSSGNVQKPLTYKSKLTCVVCE